MAYKNKLFEECRLCLEPTESEISLFTKNVVDMVESLTSIKILKNEKLPSACCKTCLENVLKAFRLQQQIIECDKLLQERLHAKVEKDEESDQADNKSAVGQDAVKEESDLVKVECSDIPDIEFDASYDAADDISEAEDTESHKEIRDKDVDTSEALNLEDSVFEIINLDDDTNDTTENMHSKTNPELYGLLADFNEQFKQRIAQKRKAQDQRSLECEQCDIKFDNYRSQQAHMSKHKVRQCSICNSSIRADNFKRHFELHSASKEICEICGKTAKNKESLRGHMFYQHRNNAERYKCEECDREFRYRYKYTLHVRKAHTGVRDHQCEVCGKKFFTAFDTKKHIEMTHLRARPYVCPYCVKGYSSRYALKTHIRQHTLETPYRCEICAAGFRQKVSLKTHLKSKHNIVGKIITATPTVVPPAVVTEEENTLENMAEAS